jgi:hypothetical protein
VKIEVGIPSPSFHWSARNQAARGNYKDANSQASLASGSVFDAGAHIPNADDGKKKRHGDVEEKGNWSPPWLKDATFT